MSERPGLSRREAIRWMVGSGLATAATAELAEAFAVSRRSRGAVYRPRFFTSDEYETVAALAALIIPSDETPGAREARVAEWIDFIVSESEADRQRLYRDGLERLAARCQESRQGAFRSRPGKAREEALRDLGADDPGFFRALKEDTVFGFYTSEVGLRELGSDGHPFHAECPACTHPEHLNEKS